MPEKIIRKATDLSRKMLASTGGAVGGVAALAVVDVSTEHALWHLSRILLTWLFGMITDNETAQSLATALAPVLVSIVGALVGGFGVGYTVAERAPKE